MKILVTGGAGFIGSHLIERLLAQGHAVRVLDNLSTGKRSNLPQHAELEFVQGDVGDNATVVSAIQGMQAVMHLAAVASVQASIDDPLATQRHGFFRGDRDVRRRSAVGRVGTADGASRQQRTRDQQTAGPQVDLASVATGRDDRTGADLDQADHVELNPIDGRDHRTELHRNTIRVGRFLLRRGLRIWPYYFAFLATMMIFA